MNDMERIQRGLEDFIRKQEMESRRDVNIINTERRRNQYEENWDSEPRNRRNTSNRRAGTRNESDRRAGNRRVNTREENNRRTNDRRLSNRRVSNRSENTSKKKKKRKKFSLKNFIIKAAIVIVLLAAGLYFVVGLAYSKLNYHEIESMASSPMKEDGVINILLIGNDSRINGEDGRSDAMILLSISTKNKKIYMNSLLRDMYVEIPGHDNNRLNAAYSFGGAELLMQTVEKNLDIKVSRYMLVNFEAFANLVDAVGGVDLELSSAEIEWVNAYLNEYNLLTEREFGTDYMDTSAEGMVHLNGPQALAYTRNRYIGTDFGRTERQRKVLNEVIHGMPKALILHPGKLFDGLMPNLTTNLTQWECYRLTLMAPIMLTYDIEQGSIPLQDTYHNATIRKMAVLEVDFETNKKYLRKLLYGKLEK